MTTPLTDWQIERAAGWWADVVQHPRMVIETPERATYQTRMAEALSSFLARPVAPEVAEAFRAALELFIRVGQPDYLGVDYHPDPILAEAAVASELPIGNFPVKTGMWLLPNGEVRVSYGYGGPIEVLT